MTPKENILMGEEGCVFVNGIFTFWNKIAKQYLLNVFKGYNNYTFLIMILGTKHKILSSAVMLPFSFDAWVAGATFALALQSKKLPTFWLR